MTPSFPSNDVADRANANSELIANSSLGQPTSCIQGSDFRNILVRKFRVSVQHSAKNSFRMLLNGSSSTGHSPVRASMRHMPFLRLHVVHVVLMSAIEQMIRSNARRIVATVEAKCRRPLASRKKYRYSMGFNSAATADVETWVVPLTPILKVSTAPTVYPLPAVAVRALARLFVDVRPKTLNVLFCKNGWSRIGFRHGLKSSFRVVLGSFGVYSAVRAKSILA